MILGAWSCRPITSGRRARHVRVGSSCTSRCAVSCGCGSYSRAVGLVNGLLDLLLLLRLLLLTRLLAGWLVLCARRDVQALVDDLRDRLDLCAKLAGRSQCWVGSASWTLGRRDRLRVCTETHAPPQRSPNIEGLQLPSALGSSSPCILAPGSLGHPRPGACTSHSLRRPSRFQYLLLCAADDVSEKMFEHTDHSLKWVRSAAAREPRSYVHTPIREP